MCLLVLKHLVSLQVRIRPSVQAELDLHTSDRSSRRNRKLRLLRSTKSIITLRKQQVFTLEILLQACKCPLKAIYGTEDRIAAKLAKIMPKEYNVVIPKPSTV